MSEWVVGAALGVWTIALSSWKFRNWRAALFLSLGTATMLAAGALPPSLAPWVQGVVWVAVVLLVLERGHHLWVVGVPEANFIDGYAVILKRLGALKHATAGTEPAAYVAAFEGIVRDLEVLDAPDEGCSDLRDSTALELRRRLVLMRLGTQPPQHTMDIADDSWSKIEERFDLLVARRTGFWVGLPPRHSDRRS